MIRLRPETTALLEDIEKRISPEAEERLDALWLEFLQGRFRGDIFRPRRGCVTEPGTPLSPVNINDAVADYEAMLVSELQTVSRALSTGGLNLAVRANYGTAILSSLFGAELFEMPRETNTLPTSRAFKDTESIRRLAAAGPPDLDAGLGKKVFRCGELFREIGERYPKIGRYVAVYHPDLQGPLDICELMWGGGMFYAMYDEPELVHAVLSLITDAYIRFMDKWFRLFPCGTEMNAHWVSLRHRGRITLRSDSAMNLSPELYREFAVPYDRLLLERFGGGIMHFCGRGDHYIEMLCSQPGLTGVNLTQPHLNDMEKVYRNTVDKGIPLLGFSPERAREDAGRGFRHLVQV